MRHGKAMVVRQRDGSQHARVDDGGVVGLFDYICLPEHEHAAEVIGGAARAAARTV